ncbi:suppressor of fused domain protein [Streptomyces sp. NPDC048172]|uniref:suppressor of fused domain protein n=1 Tax=Streptomyces sp. NPDC048172 TaxID=3365505 RepID=UPI003711D824
MPAPVILQDVFHALRGELGEEDTGVTFDNGPAPLDRIDVMIHRAAEPAGVTVFTTIGMSAHAMPPADGPDGPVGPVGPDGRSDGRPGGRAELRLHRRGVLDQASEGGIAMRLANLATYPWANGRPLGWGEVLSFQDDTPTFPACARAFLAGPWLQGQPSFLETREGPVRVLHVVPITEQERAAALATTPESFFGDLLERRDVLLHPSQHP